MVWNTGQPNDSQRLSLVPVGKVANRPAVAIVTEYGKGCIHPCRMCGLGQMYTDMPGYDVIHMYNLLLSATVQILVGPNIMIGSSKRTTTKKTSFCLINNLISIVMISSDL